MRNEGTRAAQTAANIRLWSKWLCDCMNVCPGCAWSSRLPSVSIKQSDKKTSVHPSVEKKNSSLGQGEWGLMQAMKRGFRGVFCSLCMDSNYWCAKISQKMSNSRICWAWGRDAPIGREKAEFVGKMHPKSLEGHVWYDDSLFSVRTNLICKRFLVFFVVCCFGSVEVSWAGENAGDTHLKKSLALLLRVRPRSFCFNDVICTFEAIDAMNWCRDGEDMIPRSQPNVPLRFFPDWISALMIALLLCETDTCLKYFVHVKMMFGCAQSQDVLLHACIEKARMAPCRAYS